MRWKATAAFVIAAAAIALAIAGVLPKRAGVESAKSVASAKESESPVQRLTSTVVRAPDIPAGLAWFNSAPLTPNGLRGRVVLLDFWTYCCIDCMQIIPDLEYLEDKHRADPFVIIGVHSAKFDNEAVPAHVRDSIVRYGVKHPIVVDQRMRIWSSYGINAWPTLVLISPDGYIAGVFVGGGDRRGLDDAITQVLDVYRKAGKLASGPPVIKPELPTSTTGLLYPGKVLAAPKRGLIFISDTGHHRIVVATTDGDLKYTIGSGVEGFRDGSFGAAELRRPQGLALDGDILYVADTGNHAIRRVDLAAKSIKTIAGTGNVGSRDQDGGDALSTSLASPWDLSLVGDDLYIAMAGMHQIWRLDLTAGKVFRYAGTGYEGRRDGRALFGNLAQPSGLTTYGAELYVADSEVSCVRAIDFAKGNLRTLVGGDLFDFGDVDGVGDGARLQHPLGVSYMDGRVYVADSYNQKIRVLDPKTRRLSGFAGTGKAGYADGALKSAQFSEPGGLDAVDGKVYVADTNNHRIRVIDVAGGKVSALDINGLATEGPTLSAGGNQEDWSGAKVLPTAKVSSGSNLVVNVEFPAGYKINDQLPLTVVVDTGEAMGVTTEKPEYEYPVATLKLPVRIPLRVAGAPSGSLRIEVGGVFCSEAGGVCVPFGGKFVVPLAEGKGDANVTLTVAKPTAK